MLVLTTSESQELLVTQIETLLDAFDIRNSTFDYLFLLYFRKKLIIVALCTYQIQRKRYTYRGGGSGPQPPMLIEWLKMENKFCDIKCAHPGAKLTKISTIMRFF